MDIINQTPDYLKYIITSIGALLAILGLFVDKDGEHFRYIAPLFILLVIILGVFQAADSINSDNDSKEAKVKRDALLVLVDNTAKASFRTSSYLTDILLSQPKILKDFGMTVLRAGKPLDQVSTSDLVIGEILEANKYRMELIAKRPPSERLSTRVWYYNKEMDTPELNNVLKEVGFRVENKIAKQNQANDPTNAIWYGPNVSFDDYKTVLVSLVRAGIDIKRIGPSCKNLSNKSGVIEVGASDLAAGLVDGIVKPTKSISEIRLATKFEELSDFQCK